MLLNRCHFFYMLILMTTKGLYLSSDQNYEIAERLGISLDVKLTTYSGYRVMKHIYVVRKQAGEFSIYKLNASKLLDDFVTDLEAKLKKKLNVVQKLVEAAESSARTFNWSSELVEDYNNIQYINAKPTGFEGECEKLEKVMVMKWSSRYKRAVNQHASVVQVPFDIYCKDPNLLRSVRWSKILDEKFKKNAENDSSLQLQYFGSVEGYTRVYPGYQWPMRASDGQPNIYDCRTTAWYTQSATYPKEMLILLDRSGSMTGFKMSIAVGVVDKLLETLGDDDYFNILTFNDITEPLEKCFNETLIRATYQHKQVVLDRLSDVKAKCIANFEKAISNALDLIIKFHKSKVGSECNCVLVLITDGAPDNYQYIFENARNRTTAQIRVFTYLVGQETSYMAPLKEMACKNNGYFAQVESKNGVTEQVLHHINVLSRPLSFKNDPHPIWTKPYYDITGGTESLELMVTVASSVHLNISGKTPSMLGVMATDVPLSEMFEAMPINRIGVNGYVIMTTNNGYVTKHPRLKMKYKDEYSVDRLKPNYNSFDIDELENSDLSQSLRSMLVERRRGVLAGASTAAPIDGWKRVLITTSTYYIRPIRDTPFSMALVLPDGYGHTQVNFSDNLKIHRYNALFEDKHCVEIQKQMSARPVSISRLAAICSLTFSDIILAEEWRYCWFPDERSRDVMKTMDQLSMLRAFLTEMDNQTIACNNDLVNSVLFDIYLTSPLHTVWSENGNLSREGIQMTFIMSRSGMTRIYWHDDVEENYKTACEEMLSFPSNGFPSFYARAVNEQEDGWLFTFASTQQVSKDSDRIILAAKPLRVEGAAMSVLGVFMHHDDFKKTYTEEVKSSLNIHCNQQIAGTKLHNCYIIDESGVVFISENTSQLGQPLGSINGDVMRQLISEGVFIRKEMIDTSAMCKLSSSNDSFDFQSSKGKNVIFQPLLSLMAYCRWWIMDLPRILIKFSISNLWAHFFPIEPVFSSRLNSKAFRPCKKRYEAVVVNRSMIPFAGILRCSITCQWEFGIYGITKSNLFLVVVPTFSPSLHDIEGFTECTCYKNTSSFRLTHGDVIQDSNEEKCKNLRKIKKRKKPAESCENFRHDFTANLPCSVAEKNGAGGFRRPINFSTVIMTLLLLLRLSLANCHAMCL